jgi:DUF1680 family protein
MELALYNSAIAGLQLAGDAFFYQNPLESRNGAERSKWIGLACCPTNHARFTPQVGGFVYARLGAKLFVNLYAAGAGRIDMAAAGKVSLHQETNYPWDGMVKLTVTPDQPAAFDLRLRIPGWARGLPVPGDLYRFADPHPPPVALKVNGESVAATPGKDGYVSIDRTWKPGDLVELDFPMPVRRVLAHEKIEANTGKAALMRGPVVYAFEGIDNPDAGLFEVTLPRTADVAAGHRPDLLGGITVLRTTGHDQQGQAVPLTAIPYFAWANRGKSPMTVWIKD